MANCSVFWDSFNGSIPDSLMHIFIFYCYAICVIGIICNVVVLCCVLGCSRTSPSVKVLLCALFSCTLIMCLLVMPFMAHLSFSKLRCEAVPVFVIRSMLLLYIVLTKMELLYIAAIAVIRAMAVWSRQRHQVKMCSSVSLVVGIGVYASATVLILYLPLWIDSLPKWYRMDEVVLLYNAVHFLLPVLLILACYLSMMIVALRNKHRLAASQHKAGAGQVMDQATRAMLAVFISNLLLGLPHSIYHILPNDPQVLDYVIVHCVFFTHLFTDPLVFVCFNLHHRRRVLHALTSFLRWVSRRLPAPVQSMTKLPLHDTPQTSSDGSRGEQVQEHGATQ